jgi:lipopolysaccharide transport system ATP-binding protein
VSAVSIHVQGVSKRYVIGGADPTAHSFREMLSGTLSAPFRRLRRLQGEAPAADTFWALKDVSFEVREGAVLGIIGANGAGKSTLLKLLSRITDPTEGAIAYRGRLATLLEVGTGFHPELSGRENVYLNGAILGMNRREIRARFDEIVEFADVARFLDTPVKRYSSGMYVRLAFAVAAHMDPDILLVDEVLSVGDTAFQKKCLNKLGEVSEGGRTVLFVSHNLDAVQRLCRESLLLKAGRLAFHGATGEAVARYLEGGRRLQGSADLTDVTERWGSGQVRITSVTVEHATGGSAATLMAGEDYSFILHHHAEQSTGPVDDAYLSLELADVRGATVWLVSSLFTQERLVVGTGAGAIECRVSDFSLAPGDYTLTLYLGRRNGETLDCLNHVLSVTVGGGDYFGSGHPGLPEHCRTLTRAAWSAR